MAAVLHCRGPERVALRLIENERVGNERKSDAHSPQREGSVAAERNDTSDRDRRFNSDPSAGGRDSDHHPHQGERPSQQLPLHNSTGSASSVSSDASSRNMPRPQSQPVGHNNPTTPSSSHVEPIWVYDLEVHAILPPLIPFFTHPHLIRSYRLVRVESERQERLRLQAGGEAGSLLGVMGPDASDSVGSSLLPAGIRFDPTSGALLGQVVSPFDSPLTITMEAVGEHGGCTWSVVLRCASPKMTSATVGNTNGGTVFCGWLGCRITPWAIGTMAALVASRKAECEPCKVDDTSRHIASLRHTVAYEATALTARAKTIQASLLESCRNGVDCDMSEVASPISFPAHPITSLLLRIFEAFRCALLHSRAR